MRATSHVTDGKLPSLSITSFHDKTDYKILAVGTLVWVRYLLNKLLSNLIIGGAVTQSLVGRQSGHTGYWGHLCMFNRD